ncbi:hypothetical protein OG852_47945 [Streptomyces sp. NBC_00582]|nr:hypothetical protein OG852_47945 [Streptomyces sp. NBC_00582]
MPKSTTLACACPSEDFGAGTLHRAAARPSRPPARATDRGLVQIQQVRDGPPLGQRPSGGHVDLGQHTEPAGYRHIRGGCSGRDDFHLRADGRLTPEPPSAAEQPEEFTYDPMDPVPTVGGALLLTDDFRPGPLDQTAVEAREDVLVFTTEPRAEDVEATGRVEAVLFAATDGPSTDWVARLCDVDEHGLSRNVTDRQRRR